jgi:hypothetical protein
MAISLHQAINMVNTHNRPGGRPLVVSVSCTICSNEFARMVTDAALAHLHAKRTVCPRVECQREARRRRQRGE